MREPLTMSAEREKQIFGYTYLTKHNMLEVENELKAQRAAHKRTQEASTMYAKALSIIGDDCEKLREQIRHSREVSTALLNALVAAGEQIEPCASLDCYEEGHPYCAFGMRRAAIAIAEKFEKENLNERTPNPTPN